MSAPGEIFFRIFAAAHLNESHADRPLSIWLGFVLYRVLTLVAHWETNYSMADGRAFVQSSLRDVVLSCFRHFVTSCFRAFVPDLILDSYEPQASGEPV